MNTHANPRYVDRVEKRQAEFLIKEHVPLDWMTRIGVSDEAKALVAQSILAQNNVNLAVDIMSDWYFLGQ